MKFRTGVNVHGVISHGIFDDQRFISRLWHWHWWGRT